jgi:hypothetical protein
MPQEKRRPGGTVAALISKTQTDTENSPTAQLPQAELDPIRRVREPQKAALLSAGVPPKLILLGFVGAARVVFEGATYHESEDGEAAFLVPVRVDPDNPNSFETEDPAGAVWLGDVIDVVAFAAKNPNRWATQRDSAVVLGAIEPQLLSPVAVPIWRTPLNWLRASAVGLCPLTRHRGETQQILLTCRSILGEDAGHARELKRITGRPYPIPKISIAPATRAVAA